MIEKYFRYEREKIDIHSVLASLLKIIQSLNASNDFKGSLIKKHKGFSFR